MLLLLENPLNESPLAFPILECIHIVGFAFSVGTIAAVDFRMLNWWTPNQTPGQIYRSTFLWTLIGIGVMIGSGMLLYSSDPDMYYLNMAFLFKMLCLVLAIVFNYTVHRKAATAVPTPSNAGTVALTSLVLWGSVVFGGIFIAFVNQGLSFK